MEDKNILTATLFFIVIAALAVFFIPLDTGTITDVIDNKKETRVIETTGTMVSQAKEITKTECNPDIWNNWNTLTEEEQFEKDGYSKGAQQGLFISTINIDLFINENMQVKESIQHTAWHECAHAKMYILPSETVQETYTKITNHYPECLGYEDECFADTMAEYKLNGQSEFNGYLGKPSTPEQLMLAKEVWEATGQVSHKNKHNGQHSWITVIS